MPAAFVQTAADLLALGLAPVPTGGDDGKKPLVGGYNRTRLTPAKVAALSRTFRNANVALACGLSGIAVVDVDDPTLLEPMLKRFGETPLVVRTGGRGGYHLFYRGHQDVWPADLRSEGIAVEIKAQGNIVVVPPSVNFSSGRAYEFVRGRFERALIDVLPVIDVRGVYGGEAGAQTHRIREGKRNAWLWRQCMIAAQGAELEQEALLEIAGRLNEECDPPLTKTEVGLVAGSAWHMTKAGRNWFGMDGVAAFSRLEVERIVRDNPGNELAMLLRLRLDHGARVARGETFALATRAMEEADSYPGWSRKNYRTALSNLKRKKYLRACPESNVTPLQYTLIDIENGKEAPVGKL